MYKKVILLLCLALFFGCGNKITDDTSENKSDSVDKSVNIINEEHLIGVFNNVEALSIMNNVMKEFDGSCEKEYCK